MSTREPRQFVASDAKRASVPLLVGLVGPSGSGKTKSALRLAEGMQRVVGGEIAVIDTEARRALHYADHHRFKHVEFGAPFDPLSYLDAVQHCISIGAKVIVVDSASHMHEGPGGTLEAHEAECERLMGAWKTNSRDKVQMSAWQRPKAELRQFLNAILQMQVNLIFCFRAKEKLKIVPGKQPQALGFMPIAGEEMIYEMTLNCLLYPGSGGVPSWHPEEMGERAIVKLPGQFNDLFSAKKPLDEETGEALARWAAGGSMVPAAVAPRQGRSTLRQEMEHLKQRLMAAGLDTPNQRAEWLCTATGRQDATPSNLTADELRRAQHEAELLPSAHDDAQHAREIGEDG